MLPEAHNPMTFFSSCSKSLVLHLSIGSPCQSKNTKAPCNLHECCTTAGSHTTCIDLHGINSTWLCFRDAGAISSLVALLQPGVELPSDLLKAVLKLLLGLAHDELSCEAIQQASGVARIIKLLEYAKDDQVRLPALLPVQLSGCCPANQHVRTKW